MPNFQGQISEEELISPVAYTKGLDTRQSNPSATMAEPTAVYPVGPQPKEIAGDTQRKVIAHFAASRSKR